GLNDPFAYRSKLTLRDTYTSSLRWTPLREYSLAGGLAPLKTFTIMNTFDQSYQTNEDLGAQYQTQSRTLPNVVLQMDEMEKFFAAGRFLAGVNLKLKYSLSDSQVVNVEEKQDEAYGGDLRFVLANYFDTTLSYNEQTLRRTDTRVSAPLENYLRRDMAAQTSFNIKRVRFTPKFTYIYDMRTQVGDTLINEVKEIVPSLNIRADFNMPFGLKLPFIDKRYLVSNRVVWNTNLSYSKRSSFAVAENRDLIDINTNFDYEVSKNIRVTVSGAFQYFDHKFIKEESYTAYTLGTLLTIQF
ncbi:MAG: hypothetical protein LBR90_04320, partial [Elusimicrobiota bacterium]|nr:hypothetical protein [Elusimicrobiota bacterium]